MAKKNKLTIVITAHSEGILLHKTLISVFDAASELDKHNIEHEIIVHADNADEKTKNYLETHKSDKYTVYYNQFGDLGLSRNFCIGKAKGNIIAILDGDDIISLNWFVIACETILNSKEDIIVHPEHNLTFGIGVWQQVLWTQTDSQDLNTDKLLLAGANCWASCCAAKKSIFDKYPYPKAKNGYGNEDWCLNCETRNDGIRHVVGKDTSYFYRKKADSLLASNVSNNVVQWPNALFDLMEYKKIPLPKEQPKTERRVGKSYYFKKAFRITHGAMLRTPLKYGLIPAAKVVKKVIRYKQNETKVIERKKIPECVYKEWKRVSKYEAQLYPLKWRIDSVGKYVTNKLSVGLALRMIIEPMTKLPDYVFIVPWIETGGADKVLFNYIKAMTAAHPEWTFAVITTLPAKNHWKDKLPENAYMLDFGNAAKDLDNYERGLVFERLIVNLKCRRVHLINSQYGYEFISAHKELFAKNYDLTVSIFSYEFVSGSEAIFDYSDPWLVDIYEVVKKIYTDNNPIVQRGIDRCGFSKEKFSVHYQPIESDKNVHHDKERGDKIKILWASRISYQKNPDLLVKIAKALDKNKYEIDAYGVFNENYKKSDFEGIPTLTYKGGFDGIKSIDTNQYDVFLYTSRTDGVPNTILEVADLEVPIIASHAGGISEVIKSGETGYLVENPEEIDGYLEAIERFTKQPAEAKKFAKNAKKLIEKQHSWETFNKAIKKDLD